MPDFIKFHQVQLVFHFSFLIYFINLFNVSPVLKNAKMEVPSIGLMSKLPIMAPPKAFDSQCISTKQQSIWVYHSFQIFRQQINYHPYITQCMLFITVLALDYKLFLNTNHTQGRKQRVLQKMSTDKLATHLSKEFQYDLSVTHITSVHCRVKKAFFCLTKGPSIYYVS